MNTSRPPMFDLDPVLAGLPDLSTYPICPKEGPWTGSILHFGTNCEFTGSLDSAFQLFEIHASHQADGPTTLHADTPLGEIELQKVEYSNMKTDGTVRGVARRITLTHGSVIGDALIFRWFILTKSKIAQDLFLPRPVLHSGSEILYGHAEFQMADRAVKWIKIPDGRGFIYELKMSSDEYLNELDKIESQLFQTDRLFHLLFGEEWGEEFVIQICDQHSLAPVVTQWQRVAQRTGSGFSLIPSSYQDLLTARAQFPDEGIPLWVDFKRVSPCIAALIENPDLIFPIDHMLQINHLPLNTRGIILAVALEALTHIIERKEGYTTSHLIPPSAWEEFNTKVVAIINELPGVSYEGKTALTKRIQGLNRPTNNAKLKAPFERFGIPLASEELDALDQRNKALHTGRIVRSGPVADLTSEDWQKVANLEQRLLFSLSKLLLKYMGYQGPVVDWTSLIATRNSPPKCVFI